jgi:hypothetical protein
MARYDVIAYGPNGTRLNKGDVITGDANIIATYVENGIVKYVTGELYPDGGSQCGWLYRKYTPDGEYLRVTSAAEGDWSWFVTSGQLGTCDRIRVVTCTTDEVELAYEWDAWELDGDYPGFENGVLYRDWESGVNYAEGAVAPNYKYITETHLVKTVIMRRGREGVFLGWHSDPRVGPLNAQLSNDNRLNDNSWGEREFGDGGGNAVVFSSAGVEAHHPEWGADARWGVLYPQDRHIGLGIDDPTYGVYANADFIALQPAGFPAHQETGPWWFASIHVNNAVGTFPFVRYGVLRQRMETIGSQFSASAQGNALVHLYVESHDAANIPFRANFFLGAFPYVTPDMASEPTLAIKAAVANRAHATDFELSGQAEIGTSTTTISQVRDVMIRALEEADPLCFTNRRFVHHREDVELTDFAEKSPHAATRRFTIRDVMPGTTTINTADLREIHTVIEVVVCYPKTGAFRTESASRPILNLNDVIRSDLFVLRNTIGLRGYPALERDGINACVTDEQWSVEQGDACVYSVLRLPTMYREDPT